MVPRNPQKGGTTPWQERVRNPSLTALLVILLISVFGVTPALETHPLELARSASAATLAIVGVAAVLIVWRNRMAMVVVVGALATGITTTILDIQRPSALNVYLFRGSSVAVLGTLIWIIGNAVFGGGHITFHRVQGAIAIYLMIGLTFMHLYALISLLTPNAFVYASQLLNPNQLQRGRFLYFSFVTLTSAGYGDIVPLHPVARSTAILEALIGQLFPTTMVARLVTLQINDRRSAPRKSPARELDPSRSGRRAKSPPGEESSAMAAQSRV